MGKGYKIYLERKYTNHICKEMIISRPTRKIYVFEKDIKGYNDQEFPPSEKEVAFEITNREIFGGKIFREI